MFKFEIINFFRGLARFCDYSIFFLVLGAITLSLPCFYNPLFYYFLAALTPVLWAPLEAFMLSKCKTTPGKFLFGLFVVDAKGSPLSWGTALRWSLFFPNRVGIVRQKKVSKKRKGCAILTASACVIAAFCGNVLALWSVGLEKGFSSKGWVQYASADARFNVSFPSNPEMAYRELVIPESGKVLSYMEITSDEGKKIHYSVSHLKLPGKWRWASNTTLLKGVLDLLVKHAEGAELLEKEFATKGGRRVLDFRMKTGETEVKGRLLVVKGTLYRLTVTYPPSYANKIQGNPFLDSFEIT